MAKLYHKVRPMAAHRQHGTTMVELVGGPARTVTRPNTTTTTTTKPNPFGGQAAAAFPAHACELWANSALNNHYLLLPLPARPNMHICTELKPVYNGTAQIKWTMKKRYAENRSQSNATRFPFTYLHTWWGRGCEERSLTFSTLSRPTLFLP